MKRFLAVFLLLGCSMIAIAQNVTITGSFKNRTYSTEVIVMNAYTQKMIATTPIIEPDSFATAITLDKAQYIYVGPDEYNVVLIIASPGENIHVSADINDISHPVVTGSVLTSDMYAMMDKTDQFKHISDSILKAADSAAREMEVIRTNWFRQRFSTTTPTLASLVFLDMLDPIKDSVLFRDMVETLYKQFPENEFVNDYMTELKTAGPATYEVGSTPPEINLPGPDGTPISLSSLKGKVVLVDFWASWCRPCLEEIPNLVDAYKKYHKKGLEIYSISLDRDKDSWTASIKKNNMEWLHVSDLKMWECQAAIDWHVEAVPSMFLLDKNGVIIQKDLRGEKLIEALEVLFN